MGRRPTPLDRIMAEHVRLPGAPQLIVTRGYCYQFLKGMGYPLIGGFGSVDYMTFARGAVDLPLTDLTEPWAAGLLAAVRDS